MKPRILLRNLSFILIPFLIISCKSTWSREYDCYEPIVELHDGTGENNWTLNIYSPAVSSLDLSAPVETVLLKLDYEGGLFSLGNPPLNNDSPDQCVKFNGKMYRSRGVNYARWEIDVAGPLRSLKESK